jgi:HK97 family phage prohead protease
MSTPEQYVYMARLVPLGQELPVVDPDQGPIVEYFDPCAFALSRTRASDVRLLIDHDDNREAGHFTTLRRDGPWLLGTFVIDFDTTPGVNAYDKLELGTPISVGFTRHTDRMRRSRPGVIHRAVATLDEASIVDRAAFPGAEVIHKWPMRDDPKPTAHRTANHWPPGTIVRDLPNGNQEINFPHSAPLASRPVGKVLGVR